MRSGRVCKYVSFSFHILVCLLFAYVQVESSCDPPVCTVCGCIRMARPWSCIMIGYVYIHIHWKTAIKILVLVWLYNCSQIRYPFSTIVLCTIVCPILISSRIVYHRWKRMLYHPSCIWRTYTMTMTTLGPSKSRITTGSYTRSTWRPVRCCSTKAPSVSTVVWRNFEASTTGRCSCTTSPWTPPCGPLPTSRWSIMCHHTGAREYSSMVVVRDMLEL